MFSTLSSRLTPSLPRNVPKILSSHRPITFHVNTDLKNRTEDFVNARPFEEIPKILSLPLINSMWIYYPVIGRYNIYKRDLADIHKFKKYGKIIREDNSNGKNTVLLYDPKDIEKMFRYEGEYPERILTPPWNEYARIHKEDIAEGLIASEGHQWKEMRSKVQKHLLRPKAVAAYLPALNEIVDEMVNRIENHRNQDGEVEDFLEELNKFTLEAVALVALDTRLGCMKDGLPEDSEQMQLVNATKTTFEAMNDMIFSNQFWKYFPTPSWRKFSAAVDNFRSISRKHLREIKNGILKKEDRELTLMETLLVLENMSESEAIATIVDMLTAGIDTTATTLGFSLYFFARNPDVQERAYQEVIKCLPSSQDSVTTAILDELRYLKACLKESMRMAPIVTFNKRTLRQDAVLSGFIVPAGTVLQVNTLAVGWLEEYFPDPMAFKPERWLKENRGEIPPFSYIPFGFGPRMCVGKRIAEQEMWTFLAKVLRRYRLEYHYEDIGLKTLIVHQPDKPLRIKFIPRE